MMQLLPIVLLLGVIAVIVSRLPRVELGHSKALLRRRFWNWFPLGLTYAFLYMARYNLNVSKVALGELMTNADYGAIFSWGSLVYGTAFLLNGPLTDRLGGRRTILIAAGGSAAMNILLGLVTWGLLTKQLTFEHGIVPVYSVIYAANMYFQSFGAVSIVKVNAHWFHVKERGVFGGIFGILISLGIYFAYDWGQFIVDHAPAWWVFFVPALILLTFFVIDIFLVRDSPSKAGFADFDTADASSGDDGPQLGVLDVARLMLRNKVILIIAAVEFCSGFLRNAAMHWYGTFASQTGQGAGFVSKNWGMLLCLAGILGGVIGGIISDRVFDSRRAPVVTVLYGSAFVLSIAACFAIETPLIGWLAVAMSLCIIGVHGMFSGTASMDFGGRKNVGVAVGIIDGLVYLGSATQSKILGEILPAGAAQKIAANWRIWPMVWIPVALLGLILASRIWNAKPKAASAPVPPANVDKSVASTAA